MSQARPGGKAALTGPPGNRRRDVGPGGGIPAPAEAAGIPGRIALVGGGIGIAPLAALGDEPGGGFDLYAGFRSRPFGLENPGGRADRLLIASEDGSGGRRGKPAPPRRRPHFPAGEIYPEAPPAPGP